MSCLLGCVYALCFYVLEGAHLCGADSSQLFPSVKKQKHDFHVFFRSMNNKTSITFGFEISRIIKVSVRVISLSLRIRLIIIIYITPTSTLIILDITKTSCNNCLIFVLTKIVPTNLSF